MGTLGRLFRQCKMFKVGTVLAVVLLLVSVTSPPAGAADLSWTTRASMPTARSGPGVAAANNGKVYAIGGTNGGNLASVEAYDPATDTWATRTSMPTARNAFGVAAAGNGKIYAISGNFPPVSTVEEYDPATDTWATRANIPTARHSLAFAAASNGKLYAVGGISVLFSPPPPTGVLEEYNPATDTWATRASMPTPRHSLAFAAASNGKLYAVGGTNQSGVSASTVEAYDPATDTWTTRASMPTARSHLALVAASNGKLYAIGGVVTQSGVSASTVEAYDPATDTWTADTSMAFARRSLGAAAASNGKLYAIGGQNGSTYLATNEEATTAITFAAFSAEVELDPVAGEFEVKGGFTLGAGSDGINPPNEEVKLQLGTFSITIPAGSFKQDEEGEFKFEGVIGTVDLEVEIIPLGNNSFEFKAEGKGAADLPTTNPVPVTLTTGDDSGTATVTAEFEGGGDD